MVVLMRFPVSDSGSICEKGSLLTVPTRFWLATRKCRRYSRVAVSMSLKMSLCSLVMTILVLSDDSLQQKRLKGKVGQV